MRNNAGETLPSSMTSLPTSATIAVLGFKTADTYISNQDVGDGFLVNQILLSGATLSLEGQSLQFGGILPRIVQATASAVTISNHLDLRLGHDSRRLWLRDGHPE